MSVCKWSYLRGIHTSMKKTLFSSCNLHRLCFQIAADGLSALRETTLLKQVTAAHSSCLGTGTSGACTLWRGKALCKDLQKPAVPPTGSPEFHCRLGRTFKALWTRVGRGVSVPHRHAEELSVQMSRSFRPGCLNKAYKQKNKPREEDPAHWRPDHEKQNKLKEVSTEETEPCFVVTFLSTFSLVTYFVFSFWLQWNDTLFFLFYTFARTQYVHTYFSVLLCVIG